MDKRTFLDVDKFALGFASTTVESKFEDENMVKTAKNFLAAYLTAYYLAENFNEIERENFDNKNEEKFEDMNFETLMNRVKKLNKY
ncbi:hypothetical protein LABALGNA3A7_04960 [Dellaglioa algida]|uniref:Uncharacterized protein n=1 Tax=Dellaglioa carnosa TaxID=2995136 RepID=A0ABT4JJJ0_9LACO|nr:MULTISPECIES: hypothetical protein [Dellaglioa]MCZ2490531.1 hypothetical protein [Dellaglioa carnosa]MCZ2492159.1 hypothetical protein [Dellaglioa carnosa]MCZ2493609.1 hypothetical protein [Dellaglioa carnosa]MDK1724736.1 hypothetical protein [Dellaglioa algida]MDK1730473.1 hypothetical protein [Dellaglioa carnosa]